MALFREHIGGLRESLETIIEVNSLADIQNHFSKKEIITDLKCQYHGMDERLQGWNDTYMITAIWSDGKRYPIGFTNQKLGDMIDTKELRLGNIVQFGNRFIVLDAITSGGVSEVGGVVSTGNALHPYDRKFIPLRDINPVLLTEDVLLKCGFERNEVNEEIYFRKYECFELLKFNENGDFAFICGDNLKGNYVNTRVDYLHQLQNLYFAIIGEELEVNINL